MQLILEVTDDKTDNLHRQKYWVEAGSPEKAGVVVQEEGAAGPFLVPSVAEGTAAEEFAASRSPLHRC